MKLWEKGYKLDKLVESFMTGDDPVLDQVLIPYDCMGSMAHAKMLTKIGILTSSECHQIVHLYPRDALCLLYASNDGHIGQDNKVSQAKDTRWSVVSLRI